MTSQRKFPTSRAVWQFPLPFLANINTSSVNILLLIITMQAWEMHVSSVVHAAKVYLHGLSQSLFYMYMHGITWCIGKLLNRASDGIESAILCFLNNAQPCIINFFFVGQVLWFCSKFCAAYALF